MAIRPHMTMPNDAAQDATQDAVMPRSSLVLFDGDAPPPPRHRDPEAHGGPDAGPPIVWDFSSNANAVPLPEACRELLLKADRSRYPDPGYGALRISLAKARATRPDRIVPTAGTSEAIRRLTLAAHLHGATEVWIPQPVYGDYEAAASALHLPVRCFDVDQMARDADMLIAACTQGCVLLWLCEPCNPTGASMRADAWRALMDVARMHPAQLIVVVDRAYGPLRLRGGEPFDEIDVAEHCWQCWSPNKALGLTGVRAGWMQAPQADPAGLGATVAKLAPSWVLSAEGVAMLSHWHDDPVQDWLGKARTTLARWGETQRAALTQLGWSVRPTQVPFFIASPPKRMAGQMHALLAHLRERGIKLRDASSFGLPGQVRLRVHQPAAQAALIDALSAWQAREAA